MNTDGIMIKYLGLLIFPVKNLKVEMMGGFLPRMNANEEDIIKRISLSSSAFILFICVLKNLLTTTIFINVHSRLIFHPPREFF